MVAKHQTHGSAFSALYIYHRPSKTKQGGSRRFEYFFKFPLKPKRDRGGKYTSDGRTGRKATCQGKASRCWHARDSTRIRTIRTVWSQACMVGHAHGTEPGRSRAALPSGIGRSLVARTCHNDAIYIYKHSIFPFCTFLYIIYYRDWTTSILRNRPCQAAAVETVKAVAAPLHNNAVDGPVHNLYSYF